MTFEERLLRKDAKRAEQFKGAAKAVFGTPEGKVLLGALVEAAHPLAHFDGMTAHEHGNCEVVALLWRYGSEDGRCATSMRNS